MGDSDGVTGIAIYDGSTNVIDPSQGNPGFFMKTLSPAAFDGITTYVSEPVFSPQDIVLSLIEKSSAEESISSSARAVLTTSPSTRFPRAAATVTNTIPEQFRLAAA